MAEKILKKETLNKEEIVYLGEKFSKKQFEKQRKEIISETQKNLDTILEKIRESCPEYFPQVEKLVLELKKIRKKEKTSKESKEGI